MALDDPNADPESLRESLRATLVTLEETLPLPFVTVHLSADPVGWVKTVTLYEAPAARAIEKVKPPSVLTE